MIDVLKALLWDSWFGPFAILIGLVGITTFGLLSVIGIERAGPHDFAWWLKYFAYHLMLIGGCVGIVLVLLHFRNLMVH